MLHRPLLLVAFAGVAAIASAQHTYDARILDYVGLKYPCEDEVVPVVKIRNEGAAAMSGCVVDTWKNGILVNSFDWQLAVPALQGEARTPALPAVPVSPGDQLEFHIITVNTIPDEEADGNTFVVDLDQVPAASPGGLVVVEVETGDDPGVLTWELLDNMNVVLATGGPYAEENMTLTEEVELPIDGCFIFKAKDEGTGTPEGKVSVLANGNVMIVANEEALLSGYEKGLKTGGGVACTEEVVVELSTDGAPEETTWELLDGSGAVVCTGSGTYPEEAEVMETCCLPEGCYRLRVLDASGNGIDDGGYVLRTADGRRIIDAAGDFDAGALSAIAGEAGFCLPMGQQTAMFTSCDKYWWKSGDYLVANEDAAVAAYWTGTPEERANSGYDFWFYDPNGTYSHVRQRRHTASDGFGNVGSARTCHVKVNGWSGNAIPEELPLNVRVRTVVDGVVGEWGPACRFALDTDLANCPPTTLIQIPGHQYYSCGVVRQFTQANAQRLFAQPVSGANEYEFRFRLAGGGEDDWSITRSSPNYILKLGWGTGVAEPLVNGSTYDVQVRARKGAQWCAYGPLCQVTIGGGAVEGGQNSTLDAEVAVLGLWPNPNRGDRFTVDLSAVEDGVGSITVALYDLSGQQVAARNLPVQHRAVHAVVDLGGALANGMYLVQVSAGSAHYTARLVVQP